MLLLLLGLAVAVTAGLGLARVVHRRHPEGPVDGARREWINVEDLTGPAITLSALLLAFMLVQTYGSFQRAEEHASSEAGIVDSEYQAAALLPAADRDAIRGDLVCYTRSVAVQEWVALADRTSAPVVDTWTGDLESDIVGAAAHDSARLSLSDLVALESQLVSAHDERVAEAAPAVPRLLTWMIEIAALLMVVLLVGFTWHLRPLVRFSLVASVVVLLLLLVTGIRDLDSPFSGAIRISSGRIEATLAQIDHGAAPCTADGTPTG